MINLILIRGLPSTGKTTLAKLLGFTSFEADMFFHEGQDVSKPYNFDAKKLGDAHQWCQTSTKKALEALKEFEDKNLAAKPYGVIVSNTFTCRWEMQPYLDMVTDDVRLTVIDLFDGGESNETLQARNAHGVPLTAFEAMRERYEHDWANGDPKPPWER